MSAIDHGACTTCLRRGHLMGSLAPWLASGLARGASMPAGLLALDEESLIRAVCRSERAREAARDAIERFSADRMTERLAGAGVEVTCRHGTAYPATLLDLPDPPAALFVAGGLDRFAQLAGASVVAVVGTRRPSSYGVDTARELSRGLAAAGVTVVSGLALGIDAAAHRGALDGGGRTVAVLARGPEAAYPRLHRELHARVRDSGAVISELPPGTAAFRWGFPARNRIMAALAPLTLVVEAGDPSGSLITARFATDLGRQVAAVPGRVTASRSAGSNRLIRDGAHVVLGLEDILDLALGAGAYDAGLVDPILDPAALEPELRRALASLGGGEGGQSGLSAGELRAALARLEVLGLVRRDGLGGYEATSRAIDARGPRARKGA